MAHGPDTPKLLRRIAEIQKDKLDVSFLNITSLPPLPSTLRILNCSNTKITELPPLPSTLKELDCSNNLIKKLPKVLPMLEHLICADMQITEMPPLPSTLRSLHCCCCMKITELPPLPSTLEYLCCVSMPIKELPELPSSLKMFFCGKTLLEINKLPDESIEAYNLRLREYKEKNRIQERCKAVKEELIAEVMHPRRIEKMIEDHGMDILEACF
jgi:Leucine-rich repeat (LRR) protein